MPDINHSDQPRTPLAVATLSATGLAAIVAVLMSEGFFSLWDTMIGVVVLLFLFAEGRVSELEPLAEKFAFSGIFAICIILVMGVGVETLLFRNPPIPPEMEVAPGHFATTFEQYTNEFKPLPSASNPQDDF